MTPSPAPSSVSWTQRALFFLVDGLLDRLIYLSTGLSLILVFIGVKLTLHWAHGIWPDVPEISIAFSLVVSQT